MSDIKMITVPGQSLPTPQKSWKINAKESYYQFTMYYLCVEWN